MIYFIVGPFKRLHLIHTYEIQRYLFFLFFWNSFEFFEIFDFFLSFSKFFLLFLFFNFFVIFGFFLKLLRLLLKVTKVTTGHRKWEEKNQHNNIFFCPQGIISLGQRPKPFAGASGPHLLVDIKYVLLGKYYLYILKRTIRCKCHAYNWMQKA